MGRPVADPFAGTVAVRPGSADGRPGRAPVGRSAVMKTLWSACSACVVAIALAGAASAETVVVEVRDNFFDPDDLTICLGDTVRWEWLGNNPHSTTSGDGCGEANGLWDSGEMIAGFFERVFDQFPPECDVDASPEDGTCSYFCTVHCGAMTGVIQIVEQDAIGAGLGISTSKLRIPRRDPTEGKGGTVKGVLSFDGAGFDDILPDTVDVTVILRGFDGGELVFEISGTAQLETVRGNHQGRFPSNPADELSITRAKVSGTKEPDVARLTLSYETHGPDLSGLDLESEVQVAQSFPSACGGGSVTVVAVGLSPVN